MSDNGNIAKNGWSEYGRLVLKELERLNEGQDKLKDEIDKKFQELNEKMSEFKECTLYLRHVQRACTMVLWC